MALMERIYAEDRLLNSLWGSFLLHRPPDLRFLEIDGTLKNLLGELAKDYQKIRKLNKLCQNQTGYPLFTSFLLENISEGYWAFPSVLAEPMRLLLKRKMPPAEKHKIKEYPADATFSNYDESVNYLNTFIKGFREISEEERGISILSGQEPIRQPFQFLNFDEILLIDIAYNSPVKPLDKEKTKKILKDIITNNIPQDFSSFRQLLNGREFMAKGAGSYCVMNKLILDRENSEILFFEYVLKRSKKAGLNFIEGNATELNKLHILKKERKVSREPFTIEDGSLDFGVAINLDWLQGDTEVALDEMIKKLKPKSKIVLAYQTENAHKIPFNGQWGRLGNGKGLGRMNLKTTDLLDTLKRILTKNGFGLKAKNIRSTDYVVSIYAERN